jgi:hypothetical protein
MEQVKDINIRALQAKAKKSEDHEAFRVLSKTRDYRIGVGARLGTNGRLISFIEVLVNLCADHGTLNLSDLERKLSLLRGLEGKEYTLNCEEDGCVSSELIVKQENLIEEREAANALVRKCLSDWLSAKNEKGANDVGET